MIDISCFIVCLNIIGYSIMYHFVLHYLQLQLKQNILVVDDKEKGCPHQLTSKGETCVTRICDNFQERTLMIMGD